MAPTPATMRHLLDQHEGLLLDAYGVLVDVAGPLPGARELIDLLEREGKPYAICSNDASRSPATYERRFASAGLKIPAHRIASAGLLLAGYYQQHGLTGARTAVLGTADSRELVAAAGGVVVPIRAGMDIDALAICDDEGFDFREALDLVLSASVRAVSAGRPLALILPNPDILYPKSEGELGFTAGGMACMIEAGLARKFPGQPPRFDRLGKPGPELLRFAHRHALGDVPFERLLMVGDQVETDIAAAAAAGLPSALVDGVSQWQFAQAGGGATPTYLLTSVTP